MTFIMFPIYLRSAELGDPKRCQNINGAPSMLGQRYKSRRVAKWMFLLCPLNDVHFMIYCLEIEVVYTPSWLYDS